MDLQSPSTLLAAWVLVPLLTVIAAGGLGLGAAALTRFRLGSMTLPLGYAAGIVLMVVLLERTHRQASGPARSTHARNDRDIARTLNELHALEGPAGGVPSRHPVLPTL